MFQAKKNDKLPQGICSACKVKIGEFHLFKQKCINSNALLCKILSVPISVKLKEKPSQADKSTQSIPGDTMAQGTQTIEEEEPKQFEEIFINLDSSQNELQPIEIIQGRTLKHEAEPEIEEFIEAEDYILDYECPEYLSPDMYTIGEECSTVGDNDIEYKVEALDDKIEELEALDFIETNSVVNSTKPTTTRRYKKKTEKNEPCNICKTEVKSSHVKSHRNLHQQTLPMILDTIIYFRCGRCKTVFTEVANIEAHFDNLACCTYVDEPVCTDYQYLEDFPECDTEEDGLFSGCRTLRLSSVMQTTDDTFSCELCYNFSSSSVNDILIHSIKHFDNDKENNVVYYDEIMPGPHRCGVCQMNQPSLSAALRHAFFHSTTFICPIKDCEHNFDEFKNLSLHIEERHMAKANVKHQRCMHCGEVSENYQAFRDHQRKECEKKIYRCDVCGKNKFYKPSINFNGRFFQFSSQTKNSSTNHPCRCT